MDRLKTPAAQKLVRSPLGAVTTTGPFESLAVRARPRRFAVLRARAAADVALGSGPEAFLREADAPPAPHLAGRIERSLARYARVREAHGDVLERWEAAFWGDGDAGPDRRVALERERRRLSDAQARPDGVFGFLARDHLVPPVKYDVPDPDDAARRWARELTDPDRLYGFSDDTVSEALPRVTRSATVSGPGTAEYGLRFETPSLRVGDTAGARVYEPDAAGNGDPPTFVFFCGLASLGDRQRYWPEEEAVGRRLARGGYRVVVPDAPWHGRREPRGRYSGEPYLARAPVGPVEFYAAAAKEAAVLTDWARAEGAPCVGVGGVGVGGTVALHVAGRCDLWPESMRPEFVAAAGASGGFDRPLDPGGIADLADLEDALSAAGWTDRRLREFAPLTNPPASSALDPESVLVFSGSGRDGAAGATAATLACRWELPRRNVRTWDCGHVGVAARLVRTDAYQRAVARELGRFAARAGASSRRNDRARLTSAGGSGGDASR
jgi:dienelactone hydrolase